MAKTRTMLLEAKRVYNALYFPEDRKSLWRMLYVCSCAYQLISAIYECIVAKRGHMVTWTWVKTDSGNGLSPEGTNQFPKPMLTYHYQDPMTSN